MHRAHPRRRRLGLLTAALAFLGASVLLPIALSARADTIPPTGISCTGTFSKTCTQTDPTHFAYIPATKKKGKTPGSPGHTSTVPPSVTVSQTTGLVYQTVQVSWQNFTPSYDQDGATGANLSTLYGLYVYECRGVDPQVPPAPNNDGAPEDCYAATAANPLLGAHGLGNAVEGFTAPDGTGQIDIAIETATESDLLGCSTTVPCSLAIVPNWGGDEGSDPPNCANHKFDTSATSADALITEVGAPCSWADRITVPLTFAPTPATCTGSAGFSSEGSPMLEQAMARWRPAWCAGAHALNLNYDSGTTEAQARQDFTTPPSAFSESTDVALTSLPATSQQATQRAFTYAPIANSGIVIAFVIDDPTTGQQVTHVTLDARLVAKLLTDSYSLEYNTLCVTGPPSDTQRGCDYNSDTDMYEGHYRPCLPTDPQSASCDPAVAGNPTSIVSDPEFQALNPALFPPGEPAKISSGQVNLGEFLPIIAGGNTDVTYALTNWIESDPDARSFLAGAQDGYGMHVNSYYKNAVDWPSDQVEELDPGYSDQQHYAGYGTMQVADAPVQSLDNVWQSLLANQPTDVNTNSPQPSGGCNTSNDPSSTLPQCTYTRQGSLTPGSRVLFAVMDAADAANFGFPTATLVNAAGVAVTATTASISAGIHDVTANPDGITTSPDYSQLIDDPAAYPMAVTDYAMVPTCATAPSTAASIVRFLGLATGTAAQTTGLGVGQLSPGYAPLSATQLGQARKAAAEVAAQKTCLPTSAPSTPSTTSPSQSGGGTTSSAASAASAAASGAAQPSSLGPNHTVASTHVGVKAGIGAGPLSLLVVLVVVGGLGLLAAGPGTWWVATTASGAAAFARLRKVARR